MGLGVVARESFCFLTVPCHSATEVRSYIMLFLGICPHTYVALSFPAPHERLCNVFHKGLLNTFFPFFQFPWLEMEVFSWWAGSHLACIPSLPYGKNRELIFLLSEGGIICWLLFSLPHPSLPLLPLSGSAPLCFFPAYSPILFHFEYFTGPRPVLLPWLWVSFPSHLCLHVFLENPKICRVSVFQPVSVPLSVCQRGALEETV